MEFAKATPGSGRPLQAGSVITARIIKLYRLLGRS